MILHYSKQFISLRCARNFSCASPYTCEKVRSVRATFGAHIRVQVAAGRSVVKKTGFKVEKVFFTLKVVILSVGVPMKEFRLRG